MFSPKFSTTEAAVLEPAKVKIRQVPSILGLSLNPKSQHLFNGESPRLDRPRRMKPRREEEPGFCLIVDDQEMGLGLHGTFERRLRCRNKKDRGIYQDDYTPTRILNILFMGRDKGIWKFNPLDREKEQFLETGSSRSGFQQARQ